MSVLMTPDMANSPGNVHAACCLSADEVAYACASRYAGCLCGNTIGG